MMSSARVLALAAAGCALVPALILWLPALHV
jgi:hypothetical protein